MSLPEHAREPETPEPDIAPGEQRFLLSGVTWEQYEILRDTLDDFPGLRMTYLEGDLEIMSPSMDHETIKKTLARLLEIYALERGLALNGCGSTTFRERAKERGLEPDECYCLGPLKDRPDIAIEVALSRWAVDKLEVYRGLGVQEVWVWRRGRLQLHGLADNHYEPLTRSRVLPDLDVAHLVGFVRPGDQTDAVRVYRESLLR